MFDGNKQILYDSFLLIFTPNVSLTHYLISLLIQGVLKYCFFRRYFGTWWCCAYSACV